MVKIIATIVAVAAAGGLLLYSSISDAEYYKFTHEVVKNPGPWEGKSLRVHGYVEPGSIEEAIVDQKTQRVFYLESNGARLKVTNEGPKPDTFRDESEVVAKGTLVRVNGELVLQATELMAKCPSKYEENQRTKDSLPATASAL